MTLEKNQLQPHELPAKVPTTVDALNRAICLLGNRVASDLRGKSKSELIGLVGVYPSVEQATRWKQAFKKLLKEEPKEEPVAAPPKPEPPPARSAARPAARSAARPAAKPLPDQFDLKRKRYQPGKRSLKMNSTQSEFEQMYMTGVSNLAGINLDLFRNDEEDWENG